MPIRAILANLSCAQLAISQSWYEHLFGRPPDAAPMEGLLEWHSGEGAGIQIIENPLGAGRGTVTLIVSDLASDLARLGLATSEEVQEGDTVQFLQLSDPDGNRVVLAEPR